MMRNLIELKNISEKVNNETLILFWQFTIKALEELDIVSNQHLSMEMFLIRLIHLKGIKDRGLYSTKVHIRQMKILAKHLFHKKKMVKICLE